MYINTVHAHVPVYLSNFIMLIWSSWILIFAAILGMSFFIWVVCLLAASVAGWASWSAWTFSQKLTSFITVTLLMGFIILYYLSAYISESVGWGGI